MLLRKSTIISFAKNRVVALVGLVFFLAIAAQVTIPLRPIPITMQTFGVLCIGLLSSRANALLSVTTYLLLAAVGCPVLSHLTGGIDIVAGPRGGYLLGFSLAAYAMAFCKEMWFKSSGFFSQMCLCLIGEIIIFGFGYLRLTHFVGMQEAFFLGICPFLLPEAIKIMLLTSILRMVRH